MSAPATEVKAAPKARTLKLHCERPAPVVAQRPAAPWEIPRAARTLLRVAVAAQWHAQALYALGWTVDSHGTLTGALSASVLVRMRRGDQKAVALWSTPWPIPPGVEPPGLDTPPEIASHLPRIDLDVRTAELRAQRLAQLKTDPVVKWTYDLGACWTPPAPPLGVIGSGEVTGWLGATELKRRISLPAR